MAYDYATACIFLPIWDQVFLAFILHRFFQKKGADHFRTLNALPNQQWTDFITSYLVDLGLFTMPVNLFNLKYLPQIFYYHVFLKVAALSLAASTPLLTRSPYTPIHALFSGLGHRYVQYYVKPSIG